MRGFNQGAVIPQRKLDDVIPMRFNLIVKLHPEEKESEYIITPDAIKRHKDSTRGWFGTVIAAGESIKRMKDLVGVIKKGSVCMFDESVSIDDPNRCFDWGKDRFVMFDIETVMGVLDKHKIRMLGDRVLVRRPKAEDFKLMGKLWIPDLAKKQEVGGVVIAAGPGLPGSRGPLPMDFKKDDFVLFAKYSGTDIKIDGIDHVVVRQDKILATVEGETDRIKWGDK
jgi:chaperonin GroES